MEHRVEEQEEAGTARVHDARLLQHRQHLRRTRQRVGALRAGRLDHRDERAAVVLRDRRRGLRRFAHDSQDGALDRLHHGAVRRVRCGGQRRREGRPVDGVVVAQHVGHAPEDLRQDHAGVAAGAHERSVTDGLARLGHAAVAVAARELLAHGLEGERHVRAGVAVRDRVDVEPVDDLLVRAQRVPVRVDHLAQLVGAELVLRGHDQARLVGRHLGSRERVR